MNNLASIQSEIEKRFHDQGFSGVVYVKQGQKIALASAFGYANKAEAKENTIDTRFGIASGCKLFTAIAICQLVEKGELSFQSKVKDCLDIEFPQFDNEVTVHHLLTHSSGIPDYFDEEEMDDFEDLWKTTPMYTLTTLQHFLPLFQDKPMKFSPGDRFHYNNAGFIVLGLIVEQYSGQPFTRYVEENVFQKCEMGESGYFSLDKLPSRTAIGYIKNEDGTWRTNAYSIPIIGGADGGAYISTSDMVKFWEALFHHELLSKEVTEKLLTPQIDVDDGVHYGYGIWMNSKKDSIYKYHVMGYDPGVSFHSAYYPKQDLKLAIPSNEESGPYAVMKEIESFYEV